MNRPFFSTRIFLLFFPFWSSAISTSSAGHLRLDWSVAVTPDRPHHAFTDLTYWKDAYYVCYRKGHSHNSGDGVIEIARSNDLRKWEVCQVLRTIGDDRDPHFVEKDGELYVYFGVWSFVHREGHDPVERDKVRSHFSKTSDGEEWSAIQSVYEPGWWLWRVRNLDGVLFSAAYTALRPKPEKRETRLLKSNDGLEWELVGTVSTEHGAGEADMWLKDGGGMTMVSRTSENAMLFESDTEFKTWEGTRLSGLIHSPAMARWKDRTFFAGRGKQDGKSVTRIWELRETDVEEVLTLPSGGDTAYPGFLVDPASLETESPAFFISWYSEKQNVDEEEREGATVYVGRVVHGD